MREDDSDILEYSIIKYQPASFLGLNGYKGLRCRSHKDRRAMTRLVSLAFAAAICLIVPTSARAKLEDFTGDIRSLLHQKLQAMMG
jgi:hypothetical protein